MNDAGFERFKELLAGGIIILNADNASYSALINSDDITLNSILLNIWDGAHDQSEVNNTGSMRRIGF